MKLLIALCLEEDRQTVAAIFKKAEIGIYSAVETTGFKGFAHANLLDDWFSSGGDAFISAAMFSFTTVELAAKALLLIKQYNTDNPTNFPVRAFIMPVDASSHEN
jgi:hypothetical protein